MKYFFFGILGCFLYTFTFLGITFAGDIHNIDFKFCNGESIENQEGFMIKKKLTRELSLNLKGNETGEICFNITNTSNEEMAIMVGFVDGTITNDKLQNKACKNEGDKENFGQYVDRDGDPIIIPAKSSVEKKVKIIFPEGYGGKSFGCATYYLAKNSLNNIPGSNLTILVRKANFINIFVDGNIVLDLTMKDFDSKNNISNNNKIYIYQDENSLNTISQIGLKNNGTITQNIIVKGVISSLFGYKKVFTENRKIPANEEITLSTEINDMPWYKGPFKITYQIEYTPEFNFESKNITKEMRTTQHITETAKIFIPEWLAIITFGIILLLFFLIGFLVILLIIKGKHKDNKHHKTIGIQQKRAPVKRKKTIKKKITPKKKITKKKTSKK